MSTNTLRRAALALLLVTLLAPIVAGCAPDKAQARVAQSKLQRDAAPVVPPADLDALVSGNSAFAFDLYQALRARDGNLFFSPFSISAALAMTYAGARGETERQMAGTLHFTLAQDRLHPAFNALDRALTGQQGADFRLHIANAIWGQSGHPFLDAFLDLLAVNYGAGLRLLDFADVPEQARRVINDWVSQQTAEKIQDLIPSGAIDNLTTLVLANAIYFISDWMFPFDAAITRDGTFHTLDGERVTAPMMALHKPEPLSYARGPGYQAVELPYQGGAMSMLVLLPDPGEFETFEAALDAGRVGQILARLEPLQVALTMPKCSFASDFDLALTLAAMGMPDAFGSADFSGMDGTRNLFIGNVFHKAFVAVDEAGTEAAAATAVIVEWKSLPRVDVDLVVDRPFVFLIRDTRTGSLLFAGRVLNPAD